MLVLRLLLVEFNILNNFFLKSATAPGGLAWGGIGDIATSITYVTFVHLPLCCGLGMSLP